MQVKRRGTPRAIELETVALSFTADCVSAGKNQNQNKKYIYQHLFI
jgi:hypothetical protein